MSRDEEIAAKGLSPSIIEAAYAAAKANPQLTIRCPWCAEGVVGNKFQNHSYLHTRTEAHAGMTAIILAGGKGTRLAPFVAPKCLLTVSGISILQRLLKHLYESEHIRQAVICTGYRASDIEASVREHGWVETGEGARMSVDCSDDGENAPMGARLLQARQEMGGNKDYGLGRVLIIYGDDLADVDISKLLDRHGDCPGMTFTAAYANTAGGTVDIDADGRPHIVDEARRVINIGFVVVEPACWAQLKPEDGLSDWINRVSEEPGKVRIYYHEGKRATVNTLADLKAAEEIWK